MQAVKTPSLGYMNLSSGKKDIQEAREIALVSLVAPVLFMASLVTAAVLFMSDITESGLFDHGGIGVVPLYLCPWSGLVRLFLPANGLDGFVLNC